MGPLKFKLRKMAQRHGEVQLYFLGDLELNALLGKEIRLRHTGHIACVNCGAGIRKTYGDGYCYGCFSTLARCDSCIIKPHTCHYQQGTCREPEWGQIHCLVPHVVYLAQTGQVKVGVTGADRILERWGDQGALQAMVLARTPDRLTAGKIEHALANHMSDRTNWRKLVTGLGDLEDLPAYGQRVADLVAKKYRQYLVADEPVVRFAYPVVRFLEKARSINFDKLSEIEGPLMGMRGQYLIIGEAAFNVRRHSGYEVEVNLGDL